MYIYIYIYYMYRRYIFLHFCFLVHFLCGVFLSSTYFIENKKVRITESKWGEVDLGSPTTILYRLVSEHHFSIKGFSSSTRNALIYIQVVQYIYIYMYLFQLFPHQKLERIFLKWAETSYDRKCDTGLFSVCFLGTV